MYGRVCMRVCVCVRTQVNILHDSLKLLKSPGFVVITVAYGVSLGTYGGWNAVLDPILSPLHYSQVSRRGCMTGYSLGGHVCGRNRKIWDVCV